MRRFLCSPLFTSLAAVLAFAAAPPEQTTSKAPLREGLMVVTAIHEPGKGDFESIKQVKNTGWKLSIEGHTDNIGGDAYNLDLSKRRAAAVRTVLVDQHSVTADRLTTAGYGASRPKESNDTLAGRARNRRVELVRQ